MFHRLYTNIMTFYKGLDYLWILYGVEGPQEPNPRILRDDGAGKLASLGEMAKGKGAWTCPFTMNTQIFLDFQWPLTTVSDNHSFPGRPPQPQSPDNTGKWILSPMNHPGTNLSTQRSSDLRSAISTILRTLQKFPWWPDFHTCIIW